MRILVTGASGFIGRHLVPALVEAGHDVVAMTRRPQAYTGAGTPVEADLDRPETLAGALAGTEVAYYLVHSLDRRGFARRDAAAARAFGAAAAGAGLRRIIYLGGLGDPDDSLSEHLRSRQEVEGLLGTGGVPVTTLRAGVVIGDRGTSWEMIRQLVERLPALLVPTWASTLTQPIAIADVVRYLVGVLDVPAADVAGVRDRRGRGAALHRDPQPAERDRGPAVPAAARPGAQRPARGPGVVDRPADHHRRRLAHHPRPGRIAAQRGRRPRRQHP